MAENYNTPTATMMMMMNWNLSTSVGLGNATSDMIMFVTFMLTMIEMEEHNKR